MILLLLGLALQLTSMSYKYPSFPKAGWSILSNIISPIQKVFHESIETGSFVWARYLWLQGLSEKIRLLEMQVQDLKTERFELLEFKNENSRLSSILAFKSNAEKEGVVAKVIGRDPSNWSMTITINQGSTSNLDLGDAVINGEGLVGRISSINKNYATVLLLTDPSSSVGGMTQDSRVNGMIEGSFSNEELKLNFVENSLSAQITLGERVMTSGLDGIFPKGIFIGNVKSLKNSNAGLFQEISVQPIVDFRKLETVLVLNSPINSNELSK